MWKKMMVMGYIGVLSFSASAQSLSSHELPVSRRSESNERLVYKAQIDSPASPVKALLVVLPSNFQGTASSSSLQPSFTATEPAFFPITRHRSQLLDSGFEIAWLSVPTNLGITSLAATDPRLLSDLEQVIAALKKARPHSPLVLVGTSGASMTAMSLAMRSAPGVDRYVALAPVWPRMREEKLERAKGTAGLVLQDSSGQCYGASQLETKEYVQRADWKLVQVNTSRPGDLGQCAARSNHLLNALDSSTPSLASLLSDWLSAQAIPSSAGAATPSYALHERVIMAPGKQGALEITVLTPPTPGPHPVVVFNHGDVTMDFVWVKFRQRMVDASITTPLLRAGYAVAIPARPGVGRSEGTYRYSQYAINDGDPSYKARTHAVAVLDAVTALRKEGDLDMSRFVVAGQSAGGDTVMYLSTQKLEGMRGVVNFAGGRSNHAEGQSPTYENKMMIEGWADLGKAAQVPVQLVFAENDSRYSANTIRKAHEAFSQAGGKASLLLTPALAGDGHFIHTQPQLWSKTVIEFLGIVTKP